jgi:hypothetical protein
MKNLLKINKAAFLLIFAISMTIMSTTSCRSKKEGCGQEEAYAPPTDRQGNLSTKRGSSNLYGKKMRKRSGR